MTALYNEIDPKAAAWLRELIARGHIAPGDVDERSIEDLEPEFVARYTQFHAFAGIGVWSYALRCAGVPDDYPVWSMSCPCQPFSAAGKGAGFADERHLWPAAHHLIAECRPPVVIGEQVASKDGLGWFDLVQADLEGTGYACGAVDLCAAGVGAPHIRQRLWWVGERLDDPAGARHLGPVGRPEGLARNEAWLRLPGAGSGSDLVEHPSGDGRIERRAEPGGRGAASGRGLVGLADDDDAGLEGRGQPGRERATQRPVGSGGVAGGVADADRDGRSKGRRDDQAARHGHPAAAARGDDRPERPGPTNGFWRDVDWLFCRDGKWRPVEARHVEMVDGASARMGRGGDHGGADDSEEKAWTLALGEIGFPLGKNSYARVARLRGYGNAIVAPAATAFIEACMDSFRLTDVSGMTTDKTDEGVFG